MKKLLAIILTLCIMLFMSSALITSAAGENDEIIKGDINADNVVDMQDGLMLFSFLAGSITQPLTAEQVASVDFFGDGDIRVRNGMLLFQFLAGVITDLNASSAEEESSMNVNSEIVYHVTQRNSMLEGTSVPFTDGSPKVNTGYGYNGSQLFLIRSIDQLNMAMEIIPEFYAEYSSEFFDSNALIIFPMRFPNPPIQKSVSLTKSNGELCIRLETTLDAMDIVAFGLFVFEVEKSDISDITEFSLYTQFKYIWENT